MNITAIPTPGLGDSTYVFEHDGIGLIVDPQRDIDRFVQAAAHLDTRFVLETHLHNDYVSGEGPSPQRPVPNSSSRHPPVSRSAIAQRSTMKISTVERSWFVRSIRRVTPRNT